MSQQYISLLTQEKTKLESWGLPKNILENYEQLGIRSMFPWQVECLSCQGVLAGKNLVYSAPTSAGKTMIAEMLTIKTVLEKKKKVLIILPFISVVREKMIYFQTLLSSSGVRVAGFMGSHAPPGGMKSVHIGVCTIEKANSLINRMLEDQGLENIGCIVVDELHLLGDPNRGYLLELLLTKIKYMCQKDPLLSIQIVGMSATLPNLIDLANWLNAALYTTDFRPVPLKEYLKVDLKILNAPDLSVKCTLQPSISIKNDKGNIIYLCLETLLNGHSVLVFCHTRSWCEASALQIAQSIQQLGNEKSDVGAKLRNQLNSNEIYELLQQLKNCPAGLDSTLGHCVAFGVAFHHAGLTMDERDILEGAFRNSVIRVLVATSTLSSGVNLPARRVLIRCPTPGRELDILAYRQMVGRAGRMGKDTAGESFLICSATEQHIGKLLVTSDLPPVKSCLDSRDLSASLKRAILEVVASGVVCSLSEVDQYTKCTLFSSIGCIKRESDISNPISVCIQFLQMNEFLRIDGESLYPTPLAEACLSASLPPDQGLKLLKELHRARQCFVLETELHVIYQVTPYSVSEQWSQLDWLHVFNLWEELPISMKRVGELVGIEERFLVSAMRGTINMKSSSQLQLLSIHRRFYTALALQDLVNEVSLSEVATKFKCSKGMLQSLQQSASTFAGMVTQFSRRLGWSSVELLVGQFCARLQFGVHRELLDLLRLDCLSPVYARALYNAGLTGLPDLAIASATKIEKALMKAVPFESDNKEPFGDNDGKKQRRLWLVGRRAATEAEAAALLIHEARDLLEAELGLVKAQWDSTSTATSSNSREQVLSSDSFLSSETQSLNSPSQLIGKLVVNKENSPHQVSESLGISDNKDSVQSKQNISMKMLSSAQESNEQRKRNNNPSVKNTSKCTENEKGNGENVELFNSPNQETQNANEKKLICNTVDKLIQNHDVNSNSANTTYRMIDLQSTSIILQQANIQNERKRESLDLFDSPNLSLSDHESKISVNSATNIKIDHSKLQETESQVSLHESNIVPNDFNELVKDLTFLDVPSNTSINSKKINEIEKHNQSTLKLVKSEKEFIDKDIISDLSLLNHDDTVFGEIYFSTPENVKTDIEVKKTRSSFNLFDSPNSFTFLGNLDALNIDDTYDLDLIDSNVGGDSILEMSSRKVEKSYRKRKRDSNFEEKNIKRVKRCRIAEVSSIIGDHNVIFDDLEIKTKENTEEFTQNKIMQSVQYNNIALENEDSLNKNRSLFQSSLNIDTQLCGLLDTGKKEEHNKQLDFKLETQVELKKLNLSNIVFDEDIVFGTPEQKTTYQNTLERCSLTNNKINKDYIKCSKSNLKSGYSVSHQKDSTINLKNKGHAIDEAIDVDHEQNKYEVHCFTNTVENLRHSHSNQTILNTPIQVRKHEIKTDFGVPQNKYSFGTPFQISKHKIIPVKSNLGNSQLCQTDSLNILQKRKETDIKELETSYAEENCETPIERTQRYKHKIIVAESQLRHSQTSWRTFRTHQQQKEQEFIKDVENLPLNTFCKSSTKICDNELMISKSDLSISKKMAEIVCNGSDYINCFKCTYPEASKGNTCDTDSISLVYLTNKNQLTINENEKYLHSDIVKEFSKEFHEEEISNKTNKSKICPKDILGIESTDSINTNKLPIKTNNLSSVENFMTDQNVLERCNQEIADKFLIKQVDNDCGSKTNLYGSGCNGPVTDSFLECAFKSNFLQNEFSIKRIEINENQEILKKEEKMLEEEEREMLEEEEEKILEEDEDEEDYIASSQETNVTPMKSFRTYSRNDNTKTPQHPHGIETPDVKNRNVIIIDELTCKQFEKDVLTQKELAFALDIRNGNDGCLIKEGIGSKILKHQTEEDKSKYQFKDNTVLGFVLTWGGNTVYHLDLHNNAVGNITILKNILQRKTGSIIIWDWKQTIKTLYECCQISVFAQGRDPVVAEWLLNPQSTLGSLKQLAMKHDIKIPKCSNKLQFDVSLLWDVHRILKKKLKQAELYKSYVGVEMPVQSILAAMELTGMSWDSDYASLVWSHVETKMTELQELAYLICNKKFNLGSRTDVSKIKATLKKCYDDEEPRIFLEVLQKWRKLRFMKSQNLSPLLLLGGRRLHGQCYTHTATGRISIFEPNLQNIPRDINIDDDVISLRSAFTTKPGNVLIAADFCQLELRILAHLSQDRNLLTHLNNPGDVFITIAADWNKINLDQVMDDTRHQTKQLCYGLIYGMGFKSLAKEMEVTEVQAEEMSRKFKQSYPGLEKYMKTCIDECKSKGYVTTLMGRRRYLPQINSGNKSHKAQAERQAVNTTVQGSAADIAKIAMIKIEKALFRLPKRDITITSSCTAHLVLQLHDELIYEVNSDISNEVCNIIRQKMEECVKLSVPLPVKVRKGCSWGQLETVL